MIISVIYIITLGSTTQSSFPETQINESHSKEDKRRRKKLLENYKRMEIEKGGKYQIGDYVHVYMNEKHNKNLFKV